MFASRCPGTSADAPGTTASSARSGARPGRADAGSGHSARSFLPLCRRLTRTWNRIEQPAYMDLRIWIVALVAALGTGACSVAGGGDGLVPAVSADPTSTTVPSGPAPAGTRTVDPRRGGLDLGFGEF